MLAYHKGELSVLYYDVLFRISYGVFFVAEFVMRAIFSFACRGAQRESSHTGVWSRVWCRECVPPKSGFGECILIFEFLFCFAPFFRPMDFECLENECCLFSLLLSSVAVSRGLCQFCSFLHGVLSHAFLPCSLKKL